MGKKHTQNIHHEYISTKQEHAGMKFRVFNYFVLLTMVGISKYLDFEFTSFDYAIVFSAVVGYDISIFHKYIVDKLLKGKGAR